ncbi:AMP-binding protein, partial [Streptosporangium sp. NPDC051023]|uniref:AMP-binding protein n=1 Tax=Streptosporangium sp. NPDC051023 TaxID=3155410 RepID=UPI00344C5845
MEGAPFAMSRTPQRSRLMQALRGQYTPIDDATVDLWREHGWWAGQSIRSMLSATAARHPDRVALIGQRPDQPRVVRTYAEFDANAHHAANVLAALGVGPGDVVVVMLPNCVEYPEIVFGIHEIGALYVGVPVAYGEMQLAAIVRRSRPKVMAVTRRWRNTENLEIARRVMDSSDSLQHLVVLDDDGSGLRADESLWSDHGGVSAHSLAEPDPLELCYLGFTSGTTGEPKGAMHNHETILYAVRAQALHVGGGQAFGEPMIQLVASPLGHHTGYAWGILFTVSLAGTAVHVDRWEPAWGVEIIREEGVTTFFGAPTFLQDMMRTDLATGTANTLRLLVIAGAPVPRALPATASAALDAYVSPAWGMTECSILTSCTPLASDEIIATDGSPFDGSKVKIVDGRGQAVGPGEVGDLIMSGPGVTLGYFDSRAATNEAYVDRVWFRTGDRAGVDERG